MKILLSICFIGCMSCDSNSTINAKIEVKNDTFNESAKIEITNIDTPLIKSPIVLSFLRQAKKITTDNRPEMKGLKLAFKIPSSWKEMSTNNPSTAYHFYSKILNADFQLGVSPPSDDDDITEDVINKLKTMFPGLTSQRKIKIAGKNAFEMIHFRTIQLKNATSYLNTMTVVFFHKTQLVILTFGNAKINEEESLDNINDLRILYRNLINTVEVLQ